MISVFGSRLSSGPLSLTDLEAIEVGVGGTPPNANRPARSNPVNMPMRSNPQSIHDTGLYIGSLCKCPGRFLHPPKTYANPPPPHLPFAAASGSFEHSPRMRNFDHMGSDLSINTGDSQLREDLADAMRESPGRQSRDCTGKYRRFARPLN